MSNTAGVLEETGTVYLSRAHWLIPGSFGGVRVPNLFSYLCVSVLLLVFVLCLVPKVACISGLPILDYSSVFSNVYFFLI